MALSKSKDLLYSWFVRRLDLERSLSFVRAGGVIGGGNGGVIEADDGIVIGVGGGPGGVPG